MFDIIYTMIQELLEFLPIFGAIFIALGIAGGAIFKKI